MKDNIKEFHASFCIFTAFYEDCLVRSATLEKQIEEVKPNPKLAFRNTFVPLSLSVSQLILNILTLQIIILNKKKIQFI